MGTGTRSCCTNTKVSVGMGTRTVENDAHGCPCFLVPCICIPGLRDWNGVYVPDGGRWVVFSGTGHEIGRHCAHSHYNTLHAERKPVISPTIEKRRLVLVCISALSHCIHSILAHTSPPPPSVQRHSFVGDAYCAVRESNKQLEIKPLGLPLLHPFSTFW